MLENPEQQRHYFNVGRVAACFAACEDHAAYLLFANRHGRLPDDDEHLSLARHSATLRDAVKKEVDEVLAQELDEFADERNRLAHSVMRHDYVETEPDENGVRLILGFENHRTIQPRSGTPAPLPTDEEIEDLVGRMNLWCRERWVAAKEVASRG